LILECVSSFKSEIIGSPSVILPSILVSFSKSLRLSNAASKYRLRGDNPLGLFNSPVANAFVNVSVFTISISVVVVFVLDTVLITTCLGFLFRFDGNTFFMYSISNIAVMTHKTNNNVPSQINILGFIVSEFAIFGDVFNGDIDGVIDGNRDAKVGLILGYVVGVIVGIWDGEIVGVVDGIEVGDWEGVEVGSIVGLIVGIFVGIKLGVLVGASVGDIDGETDGETDGDIDGEIDGIKLGDVVGESVDPYIVNESI